MKRQAVEAPDAEPPSKPDLESGRFLQLLDVEGAYASLLDLGASLPLEAGPAAVARAAVDGLSRVLPGRAIGLCLVPGDDPGESPIVEMWVPLGVAQPGRDPIRLFPELHDEWILDLEGLSGSTLHVATTHSRLDLESTERAIVERVARVLSAAVRAALSIRRAKPVSVEISELRAQLIQAEKLSTLGQIVAGVVHELANPVTSIVACTDFLLRRTATADPARTEEVEQLRRIGNAADRILKFSRDLVAYARPGSEQARPVPLHEIVAQAHAFSQHELARHGIQFTEDYDSGAPPVLGQAGPLTQVFVNLFTNAAHAMSEHGGRLSVRTQLPEESKMVAVEITDTGTGIPAENLSKIFEPFFTTKEAGRGTGLGLSIVREIVEAHGGKVEAASTLGEGTTFTVWLPLHR